MAELKSSSILGNLSVTGSIISSGDIKTFKLNIPTASGGSTLGPGSNGQVLKTNGSSVYWGSESSYSLPTATSSTLGGVKVGNNITVSSGTISLTKSNVTTALGYTPPTENTTYGLASTSANGLMSAADKTKLDGVVTYQANLNPNYTSGTLLGTLWTNYETGSNLYAPTASSSQLGFVKTTSTVTSTSGLTACPIISGVPYYKNTTYSAASTSANGLMSSTDKTRLNTLSSAPFFQLKYNPIEQTGNSTMISMNVSSGFKGYPIAVYSYKASSSENIIRSVVIPLFSDVECGTGFMNNGKEVRLMYSTSAKTIYEVGIAVPVSYRRLMVFDLATAV